MMLLQAPKPPPARLAAASKFDNDGQASQSHFYKNHITQFTAVVSKLAKKVTTYYQQCKSE